MPNLIQPPANAGRSRMAWGGVAAWTGLIFLTVPLARRLQGAAERLAGPGIYLAVSGALGLIAVLVVAMILFRQPGAHFRSRLAGLAAWVVASTWVMRTQLQSPIEAIHFFEYGVLALLFWRAWRLHVADPLIYPLALLGTGLVAWADEFLQWLTPLRYWDFRDLRLNALAGGLFLLFWGLVIRPDGIHRPVARRSVRHLCRLAWALLLLLGLAVSGTPPRVDWCAVRVPVLRFLYNNESILNEFGHRHVDPQIGTFRSRLTLPELARADRERGGAAGRRLAADPALGDFREFRRRHPASADPFLHEAGAHLIRRNGSQAAFHASRKRDPAQAAGHATVAMRENQILEKYFAQALTAAGARWEAARAAEIAAQANPTAVYASHVGEHLVTVATESGLWGLLLGLGALAGGAWRRWGRE